MLRTFIHLARTDDMDVHEQRILSNFTHNFKRKLKEIRYNCSSRFHRHSTVLDKEHNPYPTMHVHGPYTAVSQYSVLRTSMSP